MTKAISRRLNDSPAARWTVLFIVATAMMMGYFVNDVMSPLESLLEAPRSAGGLGWTPADYGFFSGASGLINVFLLMLFFSGLILDRMGIRFTGVLACSLMVAPHPRGSSSAFRHRWPWPRWALPSSAWATR